MRLPFRHPGFVQVFSFWLKTNIKNEKLVNKSLREIFGNFSGFLKK